MSDAPRFTRRHVLGGAAAAGAAVGAAALIGPAAADARVATRWVGSLRAGRSLVVRPGRRFELVGLQWARPASASIQLRTRVVAGAWGPWAPASATGHDGDGRAGADAFGEPVWVGSADELELRADRVVEDVRVHVVAGGAPAGPAVSVASAVALPLAQPVLPAGPGQPPIIARSAWAGGRRPAAGPFYGAVELAIVHHTETPNGYTAGQVPSALLAIYDYHRYVRGFFDIAYNFIVDAFGRIWEARAGGIDAPVLGAHAGGFNAVSTGVAVLGSFAAAPPPSVSLDALEQLLAFKLALHTVPARGEVAVRVDPAGAGYTRFAPDQRVLLPRIAGHRQADQTDCPGDAFFHRLPAIRSRVAALEGVPARLTLLTPTALVGPGQAVVLSGQLTAGDGSALAGAPLIVQSLPGASTVAVATTDANGRWTASLTPDRSLVVRALHAAAPAVSSPVLLVTLVPVITLTAATPGPSGADGTGRVTGTITPARSRVTLDVYRLAAGHRVLVSSTRVTTHGGRFTARLRLGKRRHGTFVAVARFAGDMAYGPAASPPLRFSR